MGKYAVEGHSSFYSSANQSNPTTFLGTCRYWVDHFNMLFHIHVVDFALGAFQKIYGDQPLKMKTAG